MIDSPLLSASGGYINGEWQMADNGRTLAVTNPVDHGHLADVASMGADETRRAIAAAEAALAHPADLDQRRRWLEAIADTLTRNREEVGRILCLEHGKPLGEAQGEVDYAAGFFRYAASHIDALASHTLDEQPRNCRWHVHHRPAGVVGLITPWNFPIGMIAKKLSSAIAADCASVIKPSSKTPLTMIALFTLLDREVGLPAGKANLVIGSAGPITDTLFDAASVRVISFTGSTEVGRTLIEQSAPGIKRLTLELGGNAPYIIFADADLDHAADQLIGNKFRGGGQTCVCANRIFVHRDVAAAFADKLADRVNALTVGDGMDPATRLGPLIDENAVAKVRRHVDDAVAKGATRVFEGDTSGLPGTFYPPTVLLNVPADAACYREETFGPLVPIITFSDESEVVAMANDTDFGLAAYVFTRDETRGHQVIARLHFGHAALNTGSGPTPEAPFGGMKQSGFGREGGLEGLFEFTETQTVPVG
ncbi:NAD-dependent succinate-semialdehyde dehydrogenase [Spiribacter vilamensis]|uniref:Succinate-semialdehyde dehydrogenase/glutarate-semialdehyde dehydrogenase n=1 Tax=Spiribacter vilamensis TaxID=531306 RepID=A0A4Q8D0W6_9GAMM|nr:NAD-dependent succinate-semialdehyde dehydrogenase [Spiribacter vilamensis]RZU99011.1 succinate-semialdehyde dehydrogenase/glutarate-semialdehyde dehydrogenase [Spiribacter vilamensis]TVO61985.1 NAD-dependent succinate-semialdehyde dehydrogenase [Spiribacter vilamensis]